MKLVRKTETVEFTYESEKEQTEHEQRMTELNWKMTQWYSGGDDAPPGTEYQRDINVPG